MIMQVTLVFCFLSIFVFGGFQQKYSKMIAVLIQSLAFAGFVFTVFPELSTQLAMVFGVDRGVDIGLYLYVPISLLLILHLNAKLRQQTVITTTLVRQHAIDTAKLGKSQD